MTDKTPLGEEPEGTRIDLDPPTDTGDAGQPEAAATETVVVLTATGTGDLPAQIPVVDENGNVVAVYTAGPAPAVSSQSGVADDIKDVFEEIGVEEDKETPEKLEFALGLRNRIITYHNVTDEIS